MLFKTDDHKKTVIFPLAAIEQGFIEHTIPQASCLQSELTHIDMDKATARISDKNTEFCCRFIHVRRDILLSESSMPVEYGRSSESKSTVDIAGAITLSITIISFLVALQFTKMVIGSHVML
jgi:hypothetical protein